MVACVVFFQYPISFVLYFFIDKDKVINRLQVASAKHPTTQPQAGKKAEAPKQSDEADSSRTQVVCPCFTLV